MTVYTIFVLFFTPAPAWLCILCLRSVFKRLYQKKRKLYYTYSPKTENKSNDRNKMVETSEIQG